MRRLFALMLLAFLAPTCFAEDGTDGCAGYIESLPATITTQGVWCLKHDLSTAITNGPAVTLANNNVTLDCRGFKLGGLPAGPTSLGTGILVNRRINATVRNCTVRGFFFGMYVRGAGHLVENNLIDHSLSIGMWVIGENHLVRNNRVFDTGSADSALGMSVEGDLIENMVSGVSGPSPVGIQAYGAGAEVRGNRVRNVIPLSGAAKGIWSLALDQTFVGNRVVNAGLQQPGVAIAGNVNLPSYCSGNTAAGFVTGLANCQDLGGNAIR